MARAIQKIIKQGNSAMVTIPRVMMHALDWLPGELLQLETMADGTLVLRQWESTKITQSQSPGMITERPPVVRP